MPAFPESLVSRADAIAGAGVEEAVRRKHRFRLRRLGHADALAPPDDRIWAGGDPEPREGCSLDVLVDGAEAFGVIAAAIEQAREFVHIAGWHVAPHLELVRAERPRVLGALLAEVAQWSPPSLVELRWHGPHSQPGDVLVVELSQDGVDTRVTIRHRRDGLVPGAGAGGVTGTWWGDLLRRLAAAPFGGARGGSGPGDARRVEPGQP